MSYNHEPQFKSQFTTVQDLINYVTMKSEWLRFSQGLEEVEPSVNDMYTRYRRARDIYFEISSTHRRDLDAGLVTRFANLCNTYPLTDLQQLEIVGLASFSLTTGQGILGRYSHYKAECIALHVDNDYIQEIYDEMRSNSDACFQCNDCEEWTLTEDGRFIDDEHICDSCVDDNYVYSEYLDRYIPNGEETEAIDQYGNEVTLDMRSIPYDFTWNDDTDRYEHDNYEDRSNWVIGDYHENRRNYEPVKSAWTDKNKRFFGVELEVEVVQNNERNKKALAIRDYVNDLDLNTDLPVVFERDGSLNNGFEIISQPFGLDNHRKLWEWTKDTTITRGLRSHLTDTCGLHVHVNRDSLTNLTIARAVYFVNHQANKHLISTIARRYNAGYCKAKSKKLSTSHRSDMAERYEMINITNSKTIEFRIFRGSLKYEAIIAAIEFCHAVLNFAAHNSNLHLSTEAFLKFIFDPAQRSDTGILRQYLMERNPSFRKDFERLVKPEMKKLIPKPELILTNNTPELAEV